MNRDLDGLARKHKLHRAITEIEQGRNVYVRATFLGLRKKYGDDAVDDCTNGFANAMLDGESDVLRNRTDDCGSSVFDAAIVGRTDRFVLRFRKPR